jgi:hypothetical protein
VLACHIRDGSVEGHGGEPFGTDGGVRLRRLTHGRFFGFLCRLVSFRCLCEWTAGS